MTDDPRPDDAIDRLLSGVRLTPRASLGPEIAGRVRRGEVSKGGRAPRRVPTRRALAAAVALLVTVPAGLALRYATMPVLRVDQCCSDLDGGSHADDGYVVRAKGRRIEGITVYEDLDGDRRFSTGDRVRLVRADRLVMAPDSVHASIRICCVDLDGEGPADDGLLVLNGAGERVLLAGVFERGTRTPMPELR